MMDYKYNTALTSQQNGNKENRPMIFVKTVIKRCQDDKGFAARLRRADNPITEYQAWEILANFEVDIENDFVRLPYEIVGAAIAKAGVQENGTNSIGKALANVYEDGKESQPAKARLRRLLACQSTQELCRFLRPVLSLVHSKGNPNLDYARLLSELLEFRWRPKDIQAKWAMDFYSTPMKERA